MPNAPQIDVDTILPKASGSLSVARIDEARCIGCTLCMTACPFDAIVGATKLMHTVIAERCTGCELCLPPCPVDCIALLTTGRSWTEADAELARDRFAHRRARTAGRASPADADKTRRQAAVAAALARARERRARTSRGPR